MEFESKLAFGNEKPASTNKVTYQHGHPKIWRRSPKPLSHLQHGASHLDFLSVVAKAMRWAGQERIGKQSACGTGM